MQSQAADENAVISAQELKEMAGATGPCVSLYMPVAPTGVDRREHSVRFKIGLQEAGERLSERGMNRDEIGAFLEPIQILADREEFGGGKSLALFRSKDLFRHISLPWEMEEMVTVADHFQIRPLLGLLHKPKLFYVVGLSQKNVTLLRCTHSSAEEVELPDTFPRNLQRWLDTDKPDHVQDNRSTGGPSTGSMKGVMFGTNSDVEKKDEYLWHFYKAVDKAVHDLLKDDPAPVVAAGVDYELALFRRISKNPNLLEGGVNAAPEASKGVDLRQKAAEIVDAQSTDALERALVLYEKQGGTERVSIDAANILKAAREGRVAYLFLADDVDASERYNVAALQTLLNSGQVHLLARERVPGGGSMSALFRY